MTSRVIPIRQQEGSLSQSREVAVRGLFAAQECLKALAPRGGLYREFDGDKQVASAWATMVLVFVVSECEHAEHCRRAVGLDSSTLFFASSSERLGSGESCARTAIIVFRDFVCCSMAERNRTLLAS